METIQYYIMYGCAVQSRYVNGRTTTCAMAKCLNNRSEEEEKRRLIEVFKVIW